MAQSRHPYNILLVGRVGNGKSSTGNSILSKRVFTPIGSSSSAKLEILEGTSTFKDRTVRVVDGFDVVDAGSEDAQSLTDRAVEAFRLLDHTFNVQILVLKYGLRFTKQEKDAVKLVKDIFGQDVISKFGVVVMTHGDSFDLDMEDEETTFADWCKEQTGDVQALFQECSYRCVLFNNKQKDVGKLNEQRDKLMSIIEDVGASQGRPYDRQDFEKAVKSRRKLLVMAKLPELDKATETFLDNMRERLDQMEQNPSLGVEEVLHQLEDNQKELQTFREQMKKEDEDTGSLDHLFLQISVVESLVKTRLDMRRRREASNVSLRENSPELRKNNASIFVLFKDGCWWLWGEMKRRRKPVGVFIACCILYRNWEMIRNIIIRAAHWLWA